MEDSNTTLDIGALNEKIEKESAFIDILSMEINKVIVGQKRMVERLIGKIENSPDISKENKETMSDWVDKCRAEGLSPSILIHNIRIII